MTKVVDKIKLFMADKLLTTRALAERMGCNEKTLGNKVSGRRDFDVDEICVILKVFPDLSADWLLRDEGAMYRHFEVRSVSSRIDDALSETSILKGVLDRINIEDLVKEEIKKQLSGA